MKDYVVTEQNTGTLYFLPRVVRTDDPREAAKATLIDINRAEAKLRKLPQGDRSSETRSNDPMIIRFRFQQEADANRPADYGTLVVMDLETYKRYNGKVTHHVRVSRKGEHLSTVHPPR